MIDVTPLVLMKDWNFLQADSYWRRVEVQWASTRSATVACGRSIREMARLRTARRPNVRMSLVDMTPVGGSPRAGVVSRGPGTVGSGTTAGSPNGAR